MSFFRNRRGITIHIEQGLLNHRQIRRDEGKVSFYLVLAGLGRAALD